MILLVFAVVLLIAVLLSELAHRSVLSTAVLFLVAGFLAGKGLTDLIVLDPRDPLVNEIAEVALFAVLFTDGMRAGLGDLRSAWRLPGRALFFGMPLTLVLTALFAHLVVGLGWTASFLVGAVLSPTDPVFAAAIVGREGVPRRLRHLLNVESGLNDGLALPIVIVLLATLQEESPHAADLALELVGGIALGIVVPWLVLRVEKARFLSPQEGLDALLPFAIGLTVFSLAQVMHANLFLAAFFAGVTVETVNPRFTEAFEHFGHLISELLKLAAIMIFASLISPAFLGEIPLNGYVFAALAVLVARPLAIGLSFLKSGIGREELAAAAWFGPKGFASVVYGLLVVRSGVGGADAMFHLIALVVVASIILHSSSDVLIARRFAKLPEGPLTAAKSSTSP